MALHRSRKSYSLRQRQIHPWGMWRRQLFSAIWSSPPRPTGHGRCPQQTPANTIHLPNIGPVLAHGLQRQPSIGTTLVRSVAFAGTGTSGQWPCRTHVPAIKGKDIAFIHAILPAIHKFYKNSSETSSRRQAITSGELIIFKLIMMYLYCSAKPKRSVCLLYKYMSFVFARQYKSALQRKVKQYC